MKLKEAICHIIIMLQDIALGVLALVSELNGVSWLAIIFVIMGFLTLSAPVVQKIKDNLED